MPLNPLPPDSAVVLYFSVSSNGSVGYSGYADDFLVAPYDVRAAFCSDAVYTNFFSGYVKCTEGV